MSSYAIDLGTTYANVGHLARMLDRPKAMLDYCTQAVALLEVKGQPVATIRPCVSRAQRPLGPGRCL